MTATRRVLTTTVLAGIMLFAAASTATAGTATAATDTTRLATAGAVTQADEWILRNVYSDEAFCHWYGNHGLQNGLWTQYRCERNVFGTSVYWFFWTN
ncbi:hypothetical protein [Micromonospora sp. NBC_01813]|uniref:hypothetical protein n=1 Tax=Micromonospora sp. NBC_01813 TaxID=2975988 RepID=UPI002DDB172C|nr:hypothetical protein [Micromonospora sp. NBC_01813]WSA10930.1 hypothetical protein OG958_09210 [Micromonospora sp. NBC_01813]